MQPAQDTGQPRSHGLGRAVPSAWPAARSRAWLCLGGQHGRLPGGWLVAGSRGHSRAGPRLGPREAGQDGRAPRPREARPVFVLVLTTCLSPPSGRSLSSLVLSTLGPHRSARLALGRHLLAGGSAPENLNSERSCASQLAFPRTLTWLAGLGTGPPGVVHRWPSRRAPRAEG